VPELAGVSDPLIHDPPVRPGGYPSPIIAHAAARQRALEAHAGLKAI
jgi:deoxyribodipyrimidine photo-lyase